MAAFCSADAYAEIYTFWKTHTCPVLGTKQPIAQLPGIMQAPVGTGVTASHPTGTGGPFCVVTDDQWVTVHRHKDPRVQTADVMFSGSYSDPYVNVQQLEGGTPTDLDAYMCVICQYEDVIGTHGIPTLTNLGMLILIAGIVTTWFWQRRKEAHAKAT